MITTEKKQSIISKYAANKKDVGSAPVQVAILTSRIEELTEHLKQSPKDKMSRRGLLQMVGKRKRLLAYLARKEPETHAKLLKQLKIRK